MKIYLTQTWLFFLIALGIEILSFFVYRFPILAAPIFVLVIGIFFMICLARLPLAGALVFLELFIGSKGHLLALPVGGFTISLRLALFSIFFFIGVWKTDSQWRIPKKIFLPFLIFLGLVGLGILQGLWRFGLKNVFFDANGYFYFAIAFIIVELFSSKQNFYILSKTFIAAIAWLFTKTYFLLFIFSHTLEPFASILYRWVRDTGAAEPTRITDTAYRVFFQSHIYAIIGFFVFFCLFILQQKKYIQFFTSSWMAPALSILSLTLVMIGFSRSFWFTTIILFVFLFGVWLFSHRPVSFLRIGKALLVVVLTSITLVYVNVSIPIQNFVSPSDFLSGEFAKKRLTGLDSDAAISSRWAQMRPLFKEIRARPFFGYGFGKTVTYKSSDPRNIEKNPSGLYTTYAFEWGYLDVWLKIGFIGVLAYAWFITTIVLALYQKKDIYSLFGILMVFVVAITHVFTPYLNHPLGIGILLISMTLANAKLSLVPENFDTRV